MREISWDPLVVGAQALNGISVRTIEEIVGRYGTPTHVLDLGRLTHNYAMLATALASCICPIKIYYSVKTNYLPLVCCRMHDCGASADVVSGYELDLTLHLGFRGDAIVFNGPMKTEAELQTAVEHGVLVNIDGTADITTLQDLARRAGKIIDVGLRVNPCHNVYVSTDPSYNALMESTVSRSKFGWPIDSGDALRVANQIAASPNLNLSAIQCHLGSQTTNTEAYTEAIRKVLAFIAELRARFPIQLFNFGGGIGVEGIHRDRPGPLKSFLDYQGLRVIPERRDRFDLPRFVDLLNEALKCYRLTDLVLACEPGRVIVSDAMFLICRVVSVKVTSRGTWLILDGGLNVVPTAGVHEDHAMVALGKQHHQQKEYMVAGPLCYEGDVFSYSKLLPDDLIEGDLIAILDTGAYTVSRSTNFIRPKAAVVAVDGDRVELCWRRETYDDVFSFHQATSLGEKV